MRKASRLFEIIQILRLSRHAVTAAEIAERLEVTPRSIYRDIVALQAMRVPIEGERGLGYILRPGFDLPPLMFSVEETEAIVLGLALLDRTGDRSLKAAARTVNDKISAAVPEPLRRSLQTPVLKAWGSVAATPATLDLAAVRGAIRDEQALDLTYRDAGDRQTERRVRPIALIYYSDTVNLVGWCELRSAIRNFRADRVMVCSLAPTFFRGEGDTLRRRWMDGWVDGAGMKYS
ncbi:YafY family transcriptional regulator [Rhizobium sp. S95]|uniref:YafY family transcriptional regulator n=1 Tax=Ciceribacter sichuanensis TaxID=2949647 RepID=A0AAJ1BTC1_9HYPH|nr:MULTISPECIES: YafY family protein [unclassified Ciceribacter]MCM2395020.1 YafY family transcriptional regulator [Ciceribacter sp. S95]MCO5955442.1 YafY family transcriptional regulator [Ciceribacter sp. S101]